MAQPDDIPEHPDTGPTEPDEAQVLTGLYGPPDTDGIHRAEAAT